MKLSKPTILELRTIIQEDFDEELEYGDVEKLAYNLTGYFNLLLRAEYRGGSEITNYDLLNKEKK